MLSRRYERLVRVFFLQCVVTASHAKQPALRIDIFDKSVSVAAIRQSVESPHLRIMCQYFITLSKAVIAKLVSIPVSLESHPMLGCHRRVAVPRTHLLITPEVKLRNVSLILRIIMQVQVLVLLRYILQMVRLLLRYFQVVIFLMQLLLENLRMIV
jgi:hypothetical protein